ncbi:MAG: hypothetical protein V2I63_08580 [Pseudomonadales bacterium]|jgi:hypothetical protein|nr:hypothetical protein [Pseudomonadales bacterium]
MTRLRRLWRRTFVLPGLLGVASLSGLMLALFVEGPLDRFAAALLALPLLAVVLAYVTRGGRA